jgi:hypothetical protein
LLFPVSLFAFAFAIFCAILAFADANDVDPAFADADGPSGGAVRCANIFWTGGAVFSLALPSLPKTASSREVTPPAFP